MSAGSGGAAGPQFAQIRNDLRGIGLEFAGIHQAVRQLKDTVNLFRLLEQQLVLTNSVAGGTVEQFLQMEKVARNFALGSTFAAAEAANSFYFLASAGFAVEESLSAANGVLLLAQATLANIGETSDIVASNIRAFNLEASDATRISNVFAATITKSQATIQKLGFAFRQVGPIAAQSGLQIEQASAALGTLFDIGLRGEQAGTALRNVLVRLQAPVGQTEELLTELGVSITDTQGNFVGLFEILEELAALNLSDQDLALIAGTEALAGFNALLDASTAGSDGVTKLRRLTEEVTNTSTAYRLAQDQLSTLDGTIKLATSAFNDMRIELGGLLAPVLTDVLNSFIGVSTGFKNSSDESKAATAQIVLAVGTFALLTKTLTRLEPWMTGLGQSFTQIQSGARDMGDAARGMRNLGTASGVASIGVGNVARGMAGVTSAILGPVGVAASVFFLVKAFRDLGKAAKEAKVKDALAGIDIADIDVGENRRRLNRVSLQFPIDADTGVGTSAAVKAISDNIRDANDQIKELNAQIKLRNEIVDTTANEAETFVKENRKLFQQLAVAANPSAYASDVSFSSDPFLTPFLDDLRAAGDTFAASGPARYDEALDKFGDTLLGLISQATEGSNKRTRERYNKQFSEFIESLGNVEDASLRTQIQAALGDEDQSFSFSNIKDLLVIRGKASRKSLEEAIKADEQAIVDLTETIQVAERSVQNLSQRFLDEIKFSVETRVGGNKEIAKVLPDLFDNTEFLNALNAIDITDATAVSQGVTAALTTLNENPAFDFGKGALGILKRARTSTPIIQDELNSLAKEIRAAQIEVVKTMAEVSTNPDTRLEAELQALKFGYDQYLVDLGAKIQDILLDGNVLSNTNSGLGAKISEALRSGEFQLDSGEVARVTSDFSFFRASILREYARSLVDADSDTPDQDYRSIFNDGADRSFNGLENLLVAYGDRLEEERRLLRSQTFAKQKEAARKAREDTAALRLPFYDQIGLNLRSMELEGQRRLAEATRFQVAGSGTSLDLAEAELALDERNLALKTSYANLFRQKVVVGTEEAINAALQDAFSGRDLDGLDLDDLRDNTDAYVEKAIDLLSSTLPADTPDLPQRIANGRELLYRLAEEAKAESEKTKVIVQEINQNHRLAIQEFERETASVISDAKARAAELQLAIGEFTGAGNLTDLIITQRQTGVIADADAEIQNIMLSYDELITRAAYDVSLQKDLKEQKEQLIKLTYAQRDAELEYLDSVEGRTAASLEAQQKQVDLFVKQNQHTGTILDGMAAQAQQLAINLPTQFDLGMNLMQTGVTQFSTIMSNTLLGMEDDFAGSMATMLRSFASMILQSIIQALVLKAIMAFIPGLNVVSGISGAAGAASGGLSQALGIISSLSGSAASGVVTQNAKGNAFDPRGQIIKDFSMFNFGGGQTGSAAEVQQEAIMPMGRDSRGRLGVILADDQRQAANQGMVVNHGDIYVQVESSGGDVAQDEETGKIIAAQVNGMLKAREQAAMQKSAKRGDMATSRVRN